MYQPKTGRACSCKRGVQRDNCPNCEGTGYGIDFDAVRNRNRVQPAWNVITNKGKIVGTVHGASHRDALESAAQSPEFDKYHSFTVRESIQGSQADEDDA